MAQHDIIIAGFGGQGIQSVGMLIAYAGMLENKNVSWLPSYGPEMRGGTSNCHVIVSDEPVGSPILNSSTALIVMSGPSLEKFESMVVPGGLIISDSALVNRVPERKDIKFIVIPATKIASDMGNKAYSNIIILGKLLKNIRVVSIESVEQAMNKVLPEKKHYLIPEEMKALEIGMNFIG